MQGHDYHRGCDWRRWGGEEWRGERIRTTCTVNKDISANYKEVLVYIQY